MAYAWWVIGLIVAILAIDFRLVRKRKDRIDPEDWRRLRGIAGIGIVLTVIAWLMHWAE